MIWDDNKYTVKQKTPSKNDFTKMYVYKGGQVLIADQPASGFVDAINEKIDDDKIFCQLLSITGSIGQAITDLKNAGYVVEKVFDEEGYKVEMQAIRKRKADLLNQYRFDLFSYYEIEPDVGQALFDHAHEDAHSSGMECVEAEFYKMERKTHPSFLRGWDVSDKR